MCQCLGSCGCDGIPFEPAEQQELNQIKDIVVNANNTITIILTDDTEFTSSDSVTVTDIIDAQNIAYQTDGSNSTLITANIPSNTFQSVGDQVTFDFEVVLNQSNLNDFTISVGDSNVYTLNIPSEIGYDIYVQGRITVIYTLADNNLAAFGVLYLSNNNNREVVEETKLIERTKFTETLSTPIQVSLSQVGGVLFRTLNINFLNNRD